MPEFRAGRTSSRSEAFACAEDARAIGHLERACPIRSAIDVINGRWKPSILEQLHSGPKRFSEVLRAIPSISSQALSVQLRQLAADGVIQKMECRPPSYQLTERGRKLARVMDELSNWGDEYLAWRRHQNGDLPGQVTTS